jgi:starvation-inducible DNA-binding protein
MKLNDKLLSVLQHQYTLFLKSQLYHWNVTGPNFVSLHELFEAHYKTIFEFIDTTAEHVRGLGFKVPSNINMLRAHPTVAIHSDNLSAEDMITDLIQSHIELEDVLKETFEIAEKLNDPLVSDFIVECLTFHRKALWMLRSSM